MRSLLLLGIGLSLINLVGCGKSEESYSAALCANPVVVLGSFNPDATGYLLLFHNGIDIQVEINRLATLYGFHPTYIFEISMGSLRHFRQMF